MTESQQPLFDKSPAPWEVDDQQEYCVAAVVLAEAPYGPFDYSVPAAFETSLKPGQRVHVPLGRSNRAVCGYCVSIDYRRAAGRKLKEIKSLVDQQPHIDEPMLRLAQWMSDYYLCPLGQVLDAVVPSGVRGQAGTKEQLFLSVPTSVAARITQLKLPPKQAAALKMLAGSPRPLTPLELAKAAGCTVAPINQLRRKQLVTGEVRRIQHSDVDETPVARQPQHDLNQEQAAAFAAICETLEQATHQTLLVHGVTGSGKTEIYIRSIEQVLRYGRQAIVLVPEISLTPQTRRRFRSRFERVAVLHSHLSPAERHWHWQRIARGETQVVVGARSAVFAPTAHLGLIVLDEEHDASFKQDNAPRYHARDVALQRARAAGIPLLLGSATPSLESWQQARQGAYRLLSLGTRVLNRPLPDVATIDLRGEFHSRQSRGAISRPLFQAMRQAIDADGQVMLLLNRRGFSTSIQCPKCGEAVKCRHCDIALTHHRSADKAICHYCDFEQATPSRCPACGFDAIRFSGFGTQRLEAEVRARFADARVLRMDSDTMRKPGSHEEALAKFRSGQIQILLGTQMIAKGLDFPNVTLVGVINADTALHLPDFRAAERTFQLVTQVAGRTGRGEKGGRVLVQTFSPEHPAIEAALRHDYLMFAEHELPLRSQYGYPPLTSAIRVIVRSVSQTHAREFAEALATATAAQSAVFADLALVGPAPAPIAKLRDKHRFHFLLRGDRSQIHDAIGNAVAEIKTPDDVQFMIDVDPLDFL